MIFLKNKPKCTYYGYINFQLTWNLAVENNFSIVCWFFFILSQGGINYQHNRICFIFLRYERLIRELFIHFYNNEKQKNLTYKFNWICSCCHVEATCGIWCLNFTRIILYSYLIVNFLYQIGPKLQNLCHVKLLTNSISLQFQREKWLHYAWYFNSIKEYTDCADD